MPAGYFPGQYSDTPVYVVQKSFEGFNPVFHQKGIAVGDLIDIPDKPVDFIVKFNQDTFPAGTAFQIGKTKKKGKTAYHETGGGKNYGDNHGFILTADVYVCTQGRIPDYGRLSAAFGFGGVFFIGLPARRVFIPLPPGIPVLEPLRSFAGILKLGYRMRPFLVLFLHLSALEGSLKMNPFFLIHLLLADLIHLGKQSLEINRLNSHQTLSPFTASSGCS
jgi:hypothetical protein